MNSTASNGMKIGIFDSGLGGLFLMKAVIKTMPQYDYVYFGDTKHLPYGNKSQDEIYRLAKRSLDYLFQNGCGIVLVFCNTASAQALRKLQHEGYRALGIIIPTVEAAAAFAKASTPKVGVLATQSTVDSGTYPIEVKKLLPDAKVFQQAAPKLVPMIESGVTSILAYEKIGATYLKPLLEKNIDTLILGCTHYPIIKKQIKKLLPKSVALICQDEIIGDKLKDYLERHSETESKLSKNKTRQYFVTKLTPYLRNSHHPRLERFWNLDGSVFHLVIL